MECIYCIPSVHFVSHAVHSLSCPYISKVSFRIFLWTLVSVLFDMRSEISVLPMYPQLDINHHCVGGYMLNDVHHCNTLIKDHWKMLNIDYSYTLNQAQKDHPWKFSHDRCLFLTVSLLALCMLLGWLKKKERRRIYEQF